MVGSLPLIFVDDEENQMDERIFFSSHHDLARSSGVFIDAILIAGTAAAAVVVDLVIRALIDFRT